MIGTRILVCAALCLWGATSLAVDGGTTAHKPKAPAIDIPKFSDIPKADNLTQPKPQVQELTPTVPAEAATYSVVRVVHAKDFRPAVTGSTPVGGELSSVALTGRPPTTEKFSTLIRVKSPQRAPAPIQIQILDPRGNPALTSSGEVSFRGAKKTDEAEYMVEWDPTPCRGGGEYKVSISIAGKDMGTWPLKFTLENERR